MRLLALLILSAAGTAVRGEPPIALPGELSQREERRIAVAAELSAPTIAIFESSATNGGSGVVISPDGYAVTNYHVVSPCGPGMTCGLADGRVREAVLVGLDPTGDIALIKLLGEGPFPAATIGDSDRVRQGDEAIVAGNPFLLAEDFTPTITRGVVSGVGRYQYPSGTLLEYADCLQTDAAINPGNSGGPLFDGEARLIGINGRGSFEKRGRVSVGVGYAVSINQVMRFVPQLRSGRVVDHASLGATVTTRPGPRAIVDAVDTFSDAYRRGLRPGDEIVSLGGRDIASANELLNAVGVSPAGWRTRLVYRRGDELLRADVRLGPLHAPGELREALAGGGDKKQPNSPPPGAPVDWRSHYDERDGYANHHFSKLATRRLLSRLPGPTAWENAELVDDRSGDTVTLRLNDEGGQITSPKGRFRFDAQRDPADQLAPPGAPGLLAGLWAWRAMAGDDRTAVDGAVDEAYALGRLPWTADGPPHDVLRVEHRGMTVEFYFDPGFGELVGIETLLNEGADPTRIELVSDEPRPGMTVRVGERRYADLRAVAGEPIEGERQ